MMDINPSRPDALQTGERPMNLSDFAQRNQITEDRVWELIEEGELAARFVNDEILILREQQDHDGEPAIDLPGLSEDLPTELVPSLDHWPPLADARGPEPAAELKASAPRSPESARREADSPELSRVAERLQAMEVGKPGPAAGTSPRSEPASDYFTEADAAAEDEHSIPADDYRDLLVFAQDAMNRTMELSRQLLATKDELIRMKDARLQQLTVEQQKQEQELRRLRKKVEDLETLCRLTPNP